MLLQAYLFLSCVSLVWNARASAMVVITAEGYVRPVEVGVYYESLCPCCQSFITGQLAPAYTEAPELMNLTLVPYGNAQTTKTSRGYEFVCQHGPTECQGNKVHSCAIKYVNNKMQLLNYVACMMSDESDPEAIGEECAQLTGIPWKPILKCSRGREGTELLKANGDLTEALGPEMEGVPAITFNGKLGDQLAAINDFWGELCKHFPEPKPTKCLTPSYKTFSLHERLQDGTDGKEHSSEELWKKRSPFEWNTKYANCPE
ncbi:gamma-interferon-inducible lysosomal thiol reductase-like [Schistocerca serialis cubense]|uniref:gamma-interferon-inducible lysosomal thiol reductase-like n=1 Tax=Schistocerca serialis cubense TaxID=2023355 RepID=UPI00214F4570|nr:gamma-interferon-inducible lysosomal thiol reductase-like [Schistocerca serialis cubense]